MREAKSTGMHGGAEKRSLISGDIRRHQETEHGGEESPEFMMRVVRYARTALSRQIGEAVRIGRRGGAGRILNSKSEYNRC